MRKQRVAEETRIRVGKNLKKNRHSNLKIIAQTLSVTPRTLRNWRIKSDQVKKLGRNRKIISISTYKKVKIEWLKQGKPGWLPIDKTLEEVPTRQIQKAIREFKKRDRKRTSDLFAENRLSIKVMRPSVIVACDGATKKDGTDLLIARDRCTIVTDIEKCENKLTSDDVLQYLKKLKQENKLPLVYASDNGAPLVAKNVKAFLEEHKIIHLKSLPHTPQHNGACEMAVKEVKKQIKDGKTIEEILQIMNQYAIRKKLNWKTPIEAALSYRNSTVSDLRDTFYHLAQKNIEAYRAGTESAMMARKAERKAILDTLESLGLIKQNIGKSITLQNLEKVA